MIEFVVTTFMETAGWETGAISRLIMLVLRMICDLDVPCDCSRRAEYTDRTFPYAAAVVMQSTRKATCRNRQTKRRRYEDY